eukprot:GFUD01038501.1.p1 GENE.GFUD01038501.1~~GFUD01038501.1.p1  ORF type:complete len:447 (+),score=104.93 GFUD01038501.1:198-1538(+)
MEGFMDMETSEESSGKRKNSCDIDQIKFSIEGNRFEKSANKATSRKLETVLRETKHSVEEPDKKKLKVTSNDDEQDAGLRFQRISCQVCLACQASCGACLNPRFETVETKRKSSRKIEQSCQKEVKDSIDGDLMKKAKKRKRKAKARRMLGQDCYGCKTKSCGNCKFCTFVQRELLNARRESVPVVKNVEINGDENENDSDSESEKISSFGVINGVSYDFRCRICQIIPRGPNRSELYRHYSNEHFSSQLKNKFGHLKVCPFCNIDLKSTLASHFGQKHDMVEEFLPEEARIPRSETNGTAEKKILETEEEVPGTLKVTKIHGSEIEFIKETEEDINGNLTEDKMSKNRNQNSSCCSEKVQSIDISLLKSTEREVDRDKSVFFLDFETNQFVSLICQICGGKSPNKTSLKFHVRIRHPETLFPCDLCQKKFILKAHLQSHIRMAHY